METLKRWVKNSSPVVKMTMAVSVTSAFVVFHKLVYAPYVRRSRLMQAEDWANILIDQEERIKEYENSS